MNVRDADNKTGPVGDRGDMEAQQSGQPDIVSQLLPYGVVTVLVALVLIWVAKQFFGEFIKILAGRRPDGAQRSFARGRRFTRRQLARYRKSIRDDFHAHRPGFTGETVIDINQVYVPLQSENAGERTDIYEMIREERRSVVIGPAGAGKSLLLKNSMQLWARQPGKRIPVLIELHRCNSSSTELIDLIVDEISRCRVHGKSHPGRDRQLAEKALQDGRLSLLFDGLDEVGKADHDRVVRSLEDFARTYRHCQIIVTCRDVVYRGQLATHFQNVVRVAKFDDAGILRLLGNWPGIAGTPAVAEIFANLQRYPALMNLARSPLLLTMIAYLHVEVFSKSGRQLPTSRPAFYDQAITHLLGRDADLGRSEGLTVFDVAEKRAVLQRAALAMQESTGDDESTDDDTDRRTITDSRLRKITQELLPDLNLERSHIKPLLTEVVERSQLLVALDRSSSRFIFRHTTLQEYLTAAELADDPDGLLTRYRADPLAWRETVKLWCGSSTRDCTKLVKAIFTSPEPHHKVLALECLAEARRIDNDFANEVIEHFQSELDNPRPDQAAITAAFGAVAADSRPRGRQVLELLGRTAAAPDQPARGLAMQALSASGRQEAAEALAAMAGTDEVAQNALRDMGELALPVLTTRAAEGHIWAVDDLGIVGTLSAATALTHLLWVDDRRIATRAAWRIAALLRNPAVEQELRANGHTDTGRGVMRWVWKPFANGKDDRLVPIAGGTAFLLSTSQLDDIPADLTAIDPRLGIPVVLFSCVLNREAVALTNNQKQALQSLLSTARLRLNQSIAQRLRSAFMTAAVTRPIPPQAPIRKLRELVAEICDLHPVLDRMLSLLDWPVEATVFGTMLSAQIGNEPKTPALRVADWSTVLGKRRDTRMLWRTFIGTATIVTIGLSVVTVIRAIQTVNGVAPFGPAWLSTAVLAGFSFLVICILGVFLLDDGSTVITAVFIVVILVIPTIVFSIATLARWLPPPLQLTLVVVLGCGFLTGLIARRLDRVNDNPFRQCMDASSMQLSARTSVIAS